MRRASILLPWCLALSIMLPAQVPDLVRNDGITGPLHRAHIGEIVFMAKPIPLREIKEPDLLTTFDLIENRDLNIGAFMDNSLTNYLHRLAPGLGAEELNKIGNYRFSFFVDGDLTYSENLNPGAGGLQARNTQTAFRVPLVSTTDEDSWGRFLWIRFMIRGGEDALSEGKHTLKIEIRPYINNPELRTGELIAAGQIVLNVIKPAVDEATIAPQAIGPGSGWPVSSDRYDREKIRDLNRKIAQRDFKDITSVVVIKDGKLLIEEYFNGAGRTTLHNTRSVGKTFTSALMGAAIRDGYIKGLDQTLGEFYDLKSFANFSPKKSSVTLQNLLTMSSAFLGSDMDAASPGNEENMYPTPNWVKFTLDLPMDDAKENGKQWDYFTAGIVLLGDILDRSVPGGLERYADRVLFKSLGITRYQWQYTPQKVVNTAGGLMMSSLDYAKFGQLYKNRGLWNGAPVLPEEWVAKSFQKYMIVPNNVDAFYGLLFWNMTYHIGGRPTETFFCAGNGGSKIFVFLDQPLVVVVTATAYGKPHMHSQVDKMMERYILPAVVK
jgi:CubicO group peptidase (beta-lactamase class C family)